MSAGGGDSLELMARLAEAHQACTRLQRFTDEHYGVFQSDDDGKILEVIDSREALIASLSDIEAQVETILDAEYRGGKALPPDAEALRLSIRTLLSDISAKDLEIMKLLSGRMQTYRNETLKARSRKNLFAYMQVAESIPASGDSFDISK